jgi:hypothetical protein
MSPFQGEDAGSTPATRSKMDSLYKNSVATIFIILAFGIILFFYTNKESSRTTSEDPVKENLANILEQTGNDLPVVPELTGFDNLSEEAEALNDLLLELE